EECADLFDPAPVHAEIRVPHARGRADADLPAGWVEQELHIVHEAEDAAAKLDVPVRILFDDERGVAGRPHGLAEPRLGLLKVAGPDQRRHAVRVILQRQRRHAVGGGWAGFEGARHPRTIAETAPRRQWWDSSASLPLISSAAGNSSEQQRIRSAP